MNRSDDLEQEIRGLFNKSIEQVPLKDEVAHAYHIANRHRGIWDVVIMISIGALAVISAVLAPKTHQKQHTTEQSSEGDGSNE